MISATPVVAAERHSSGNTQVADVLEFAADVRSRTPDAGSDLDSRTAERLILATVSDADIDGIDAETAIVTQLMLLAALTADAQYDRAGCDRYAAIGAAPWTDAR